MFNSSFNVYKTEWLDIVFSNRNKDYGAYALRAQSASTLNKALIIGVGIFTLLFVGPYVYNKLNATEVTGPSTTTVIELPTKVHDLKKNDPKKEFEKPKASATPPVKIKTVAISSNIIVVEEPKTPPPTVDEIKNAVVSNVTQDGVIDPNAVIDNNKAVGNGTGGAGTEDNGTNVDETIYDGNVGVDEYPEFVGGMKAFSKYIQRTLRVPSAALEEGINGKVFVSFVVEKDGSITDVTLMKGIGFGCDEEALKVIKKSPFWKPGRNNGKPVRVRYNVPINFIISQ
jgi:protein TonB